MPDKLEKLVSLAIGGGKAQFAPSTVEVGLSTTAPQMQPRLRLWDRHGRNPRAPDQIAGENRWRLGAASSLPGCTLTWSVRLASPRPIEFELRLQVYQDGTPLPDADFLYSGPLSGLEERSGRFHFKSARESTEETPTVEPANAGTHALK